MRRALDASLLLIIAGLAAFLRFDRLALPSLWLDEILTYDVATRLLHGKWWPWPSEQGPLFFLTELAGRFVQTPELSSRLAPALFGLATVIVLWFSAKAVDERLRGAELVAALLLAASPLHVYFSREARPYALLMLLASIFLCALLRKSAATAVTSLVLAFLTTAAAVPWLVGATMTAFVAWLSSRERFYARAAIAAAAAVTLALVVYQPEAVSSAASFTPTRELGRGLLESFSIAALDVSHPRLVAWVFVLFALIGSTALFRHDRRAAAIVIGLTVLPVLIAIAALWRMQHWYAVRYVVTGLPGYLLLVAIGLVATIQLIPRAPRIIALAAACVLVASGWSSLRTEPFDKLPWRQIAETISQHGEPDDVVLSTNDWTNACLHFYMSRMPHRVRMFNAGESIPLATAVIATHTPVWIATAGFHRRGEIIGWACRFPVVLADPRESFRLHYAPDLRHLMVNRLRAAEARTLAARYPALTLGFGPDEDVFFGDGWYGADPIGDEWVRWSGLESSMIVPAPAGSDRSIRFRALPHRTPQGAAVSFNGIPLTTLTMKPGWSDYVIDVPRARWRNGVNELSFRFSRTARGSERDPRLLSALFDSLSVRSSDSREAPPAEVAGFFRLNTLLRSREYRRTRFQPARWNERSVVALLGRLSIDPETVLPALRGRTITLEQLVEQIAIGSECLSDRDFIRLAAAVILGRRMDPIGEHDWLAGLRRDITRVEAVQGILRSAESRRNLGGDDKPQ